MPAEIAVLTAAGIASKIILRRPVTVRQDEDNAVNQNENQRVRVAEAEGEADGADEECVQTHAGSLRQRQVG